MYTITFVKKLSIKITKHYYTVQLSSMFTKPNITKQQQIVQ